LVNEIEYEGVVRLNLGHQVEDCLHVGLARRSKGVPFRIGGVRNSPETPRSIFNSLFHNVMRRSGSAHSKPLFGRIIPYMKTHFQALAIKKATAVFDDWDNPSFGTSGVANDGSPIFVRSHCRVYSVSLRTAHNTRRRCPGGASAWLWGSRAPTPAMISRQATLSGWRLQPYFRKGQAQIDGQAALSACAAIPRKEPAFRLGSSSCSSACGHPHFRQN
jgi:hypothetical protein